MREYRNVVIDFLKTVEEYGLVVIPRLQNALVNGLAFSANTCKLPHPNKQYTVEVKHCPAMSNNMRYCQVFGSDKQIESFLQSKDKFEDSSINLEDELVSQTDVHISINQPTISNEKVM